MKGKGGKRPAETVRGWEAGEGTGNNCEWMGSERRDWYRL